MFEKQTCDNDKILFLECWDLLLECVEPVVVLNVWESWFVLQNHKQNIKSFQFTRKNQDFFSLRDKLKLMVLL